MWRGEEYGGVKCGGVRVWRSQCGGVKSVEE